MALNQTTRARSLRRRDPSAASPLGMAETGAGSLTMLTDVSRDLYLAECAFILTCFNLGVNSTNREE